MKTLLLALLSPDKKRGTREGAIRGLMGIGKEAIRKGLVEGGGAKVVGSECSPGDQGTLVAAVMVCLCVPPTYSLLIVHLGRIPSPSSTFAAPCAAQSE